MEIKKIITSVTSNKCPNCLKGDFFVSNNPYTLKKINETHRNCSNCGMDFRQEPGFYFGAAFVSYIFQVIILISLYLLLQVVIEINFWYFVSTIAVVLIILSPVLVRVSRLIWINLLGRVEKKE